MTVLRINKTAISYQHYLDSLHANEPLTDTIFEQQNELSVETIAAQKAKKAELSEKNRAAAQARYLELYEASSPEIKRCLVLAQEKGASSWLTSKPREENDLILNKQNFRDSMALRYGWPIPDLATKCVCGESFDPDHALLCPHAGFTIGRHDHLRNLFAKMLTKVCSEVAIEPPLIPITGETFDLKSTIKGPGARSDVSARGFWTPMQRAFFYIKVTHLNAPSYRQKEPSVVYRLHEKEKKRKYNRRIIEIEQGHFTPLILSTSGGMGPECAIFVKLLAKKIAQKKNEDQSDVMRVLRTQIRFAVLKATLIAIRGTRGSIYQKKTDESADIDYNVVALDCVSSD